MYPACYIQNDSNNGNQPLIPLRKRPRSIPDDEKDEIYFEKRARNNQSAKRSRDARRIREEYINERVKYFQNEISRLQMENQTIQYQISQLHTFYNGITLITK